MSGKNKKMVMSPLTFKGSVLFPLVFFTILCISNLWLIGTGFTKEIVGVTKEVPAETSKAWAKRSYQDRIRNAQYDDRFTFKHKKPFLVDPFVWVYSKEFADRFHMPEKWVDNNLKGFLAAAWTMKVHGFTTCGLSGNPKNCWEPLECKLEIYFDNSISLPWGYPEIQRYTSTRDNSSIFLHHSPEMKVTHFAAESFYPSKENPYPRPLLSGGGTFWQGKYHWATSHTLYSFDRYYEPDVGFISWVGHGLCPTYTGDDEVSLKFISQKDYQEIARGNLKIGDIQDSRLAHKMVFPKSFLLRANKVYQDLNKKNKDKIDELIKLAR
jgi:hypothetical protein